MKLGDGHRTGDLPLLSVVPEGTAQIGERLLELMPDPGGGPGPRQAEQQRRGLFIGSLFGSRHVDVPGDQTPLKMSKCFIPGISGQCLPAGREGVSDEFGDSGCCLSLGEMVGQLGGVDLHIIAVQLFQSLRNPRVQPYSSRGGQLFGQGLLNQSVAELEALSPVRDFLNELGVYRFVYRPEHLVLGHAFTEGI